MRVVRAFKGLKLLRVIRSFRMLSHMAKHVAVSTKRLVLARYVLLLLLLHPLGRLLSAAGPRGLRVLADDGVK